MNATPFNVYVDGELWASFRFVIDAKNYGYDLENTYNDEKKITYLEVQK